jgi:hypothetical protein
MLRRRLLAPLLGLALAAPLQPEPAAAAAPGPTPPPSLPLSDQLCNRSVYDHASNRTAVELVEAAGAELQRRGSAAFSELRRPGSRWFQGERYVFVISPSADILVYPPDPQLETANRNRPGNAERSALSSAVLDGQGQRMGVRFLEAASSGQGCGWVHYRIPKPGQDKPQWKSTYVERFETSGGQVFLVGSGAYDSRMEKAFAVDEVEAAADLIAREGRAAFAQLRDPKGRFIYHDTYVFVNNTAGVELVNPAFPGIEGKNVSTLRDPSGQFFVRDYIRLATSKGSGWVRYGWPRPSAPGSAASKLTYVRAVQTPDGETLVIGSGLYE